MIPSYVLSPVRSRARKQLQLLVSDKAGKLPAREQLREYPETVFFWKK